MARRLFTSLHEFVLTGTGDQVQGVTFFGNDANDKISGRLRRFVVREDAGGGATEADFYFATFNHTDLDDPANDPQEWFIAVVENQALTASATEVSLDTPFEAEPAFKDSLSLYADVTATGDWELRGWIEVER